jgi:hypothetical protein
MVEQLTKKTRKVKPRRIATPAKPVIIIPY